MSTIKHIERAVHVHHLGIRGHAGVRPELRDARRRRTKRRLLRLFLLHLLTRRARAHSKQSPNDIRRAHPLRAFYLLVPPDPLRIRVRVRAVRQQARVVAVYHVIHLVLREQLIRERVRDFIRHVGDDTVHPFARLHRLDALSFVAHRRSFAPSNLRVVHHPNQQLIPARPRLSQRVRVSVVHRVEASVHVDDDRALLRRVVVGFRRARGVVDIARVVAAGARATPRARDAVPDQRARDEDVRHRVARVDRRRDRARFCRRVASRRFASRFTSRRVMPRGRRARAPRDDARDDDELRDVSPSEAYGFAGMALTTLAFALWLVGVFASVVKIFQSDFRAPLGAAKRARTQS